MSKSPKSIKKLNENLVEIAWSDSSTVKVDTRTLRVNCPCAGCLEKRGSTSHSKPLTSEKSLAPKKASSVFKIIESDLQQEIALKEIWPIGNYAIGFRWGDGHASGIYSFALLFEIAGKAEP